MDERRPLRRLKFKDEIPDIVDNLTSGQVGPKSKQQHKFRQEETRKKPSERLRYESSRDGDETSESNETKDSQAASNAGAKANKDSFGGEGGNSAMNNKESQQDSKYFKEPKSHSDKTASKLGEALNGPAAKTPSKYTSTIGQLDSQISNYSKNYIHKKIHEVEHENVGVEAAHKTERAAEKTVTMAARFSKHYQRSHQARRISHLTKQNAKAKTNHAYKKLLQDRPELKKKIIARFWHKRRLYRQAKQAAHTTKQGGMMISSVTRLTRTITMMAKSSPKAWLGVIILLILIMLMQSCMGIVASLGNSTMGVIAVTSYLAEDEDIDDVTLLYIAWETDLRYQIINVERDHPGYDEYIFSIGVISHNPFELIAFLTVMYSNFTYAEVQATLYEIFNEQYTLEFIAEVEIRSRTETRRGSRRDENGTTHRYRYTVTVYYEWHIRATRS